MAKKTTKDSGEAEGINVENVVEHAAEKAREADNAEPLIEDAEIVSDENQPDEEDQTDEAVQEPDSPQPAPRQKSRGFAGGLIGGLIAAALGFGAAKLTPDGWPGGNSEALEALVTEQSRAANDIENLQNGLDALRDAASQPDPDKASLAQLNDLADRTRASLVELEMAVKALKGTAEDLEARVLTLEKRPLSEAGGATSEAVAAYQRELSALQTALEAQRQQIQDLTTSTETRLSAAQDEAVRMTQEVESASKATLAKAAITRIETALEHGGPFENALQELAEASGSDLPPALVSAAKSGVAPLAELRDDFPAFARAALAEALKADEDAGTAQRLGNFLKAQVGARSTTPREGDDADAVLSRAEAALAQGDLDEVQRLIATMPEGAAAQMQPFVDRLIYRQGAVAALATLTADLKQN